MTTANVTVRLFLLVLSSKLLAEVCPTALERRNNVAKQLASCMNKGDRVSLDLLRSTIAQEFTTRIDRQKGRILLPAAAAVVKQIETYQKTGKLPAGLR